jgi:succinyl-CoA synthetase beta subunit
MNLHEYQAKELFANYGLPIPKGEVAHSTEDALQIAAKLSTPKLVVKAQVHAGGRGKAGGVRVLSSKDEVAQFTKILTGYPPSYLSNRCTWAACECCAR